MACFHPIKGWRSRTTGKISLTRSESWSDLPLMEVACGQCSGCRLERSRQWAVRCVHEAECHTANCFITLTLDQAELLKCDGSLDVTHWQKFAKRLRHKMGPFRFFHCGEYGDQTGRPHYHAVLFGLDFLHDRKPLKLSKGHTLYTSPTLDEAWGLGFCNIGSFSFESAAYVARYIMKKQTGPDAKAHYKGRKPEYITMSRRPGIGATWFKKFLTDVYPSDEVIINAHKTRVPVYYDHLLDKRDPELLASIKKRRESKAKRQAKNNTPERLAVREKHLRLTRQQFKRDQI